MTNVSISFNFKSKDFCLCATKRGTRTRHYKKTSGLVNPNFDYWDSKKQRFEQATNDAIHNNHVLNQMKDYHQQIIDTFNPLTGKELFELADKANEIVAKKTLTLGGFLNVLIDEMYASKNQLPSSNHRHYRQLLNRLKQEGKILDIALSDIDDNHFKAFGKFIIDELKGSNYKKSMQLFKATINRAYERQLTSRVLGYPYAKHAPRKQIDIQKAIQGVEMLSKKEYEKFITMDLEQIPFSGKNQMFYKELYRDFCIFMYESKMRPCDVIKLHLNDVYDNRIIHLPKKKSNYLNANKAVVNAPLTDKAKEIIEKYKGQSTGGYVLPFAMNRQNYDLSNSDSFYKWRARKDKTIGRIDDFLHKVQGIMKFKGIDSLTTYAFRRTTLSHEIKANNKSLMTIAKEAGTSISMLEGYYFNHTK
jgi:integrase